MAIKKIKTDFGDVSQEEITFEEALKRHGSKYIHEKLSTLPKKFKNKDIKKCVEEIHLNGLFSGWEDLYVIYNNDKFTRISLIRI